MILGIDHIGIAVNDLDAAIALYRDTLGLTEEGVHVIDGMRIAAMRAGETMVELIHPLGEAGGVAKFLRDHGEGVHHICLLVNDIKHQLAEVKEKGVAIIDETPRAGIVGLVAFLHPKSTMRVLVEYKQKEGGSSHG